MPNQLKKIAVGVSDFEEIVSDNYYYIDKSLLIKEIIDDGSKVILIPRPRRFGKTLNMTMLKEFFEKTDANKSKLFDGLKIWRNEEYRQYLGRYPVIWLTFKDVKCDEWEECYTLLRRVISREFSRHDYLLKSDVLNELEKLDYKKVCMMENNKELFMSSLLMLSEFLNKYYNQKVIVLIDEYDTPIHSGYMSEYYDEIISLMRGLLGGVLKDNPNMEKGVLTGILRVAKESIFSGLNNPNVCTILNNDGYSDKFGLLDNEVEEMLIAYNIKYEMDEVRDWYNGYLFGEKTVYNPWSIINFVQKWKDGLKPYWINTSSNDIVKDLITNGDINLKEDFETLIKGDSISKEIYESISMPEIDNGSNNVWSFLLFSGYLKVTKMNQVGIRRFYDIKVPNNEVMYLYQQIILNWFNENMRNTTYDMMLESLTSGDVETFEYVFSEYVVNTFSYFDASSEQSYHAFVLGMLLSLSNTHEVISNKESGFGRLDIMIIPKDICKLGIIIEFKKVNSKRKETLEKAVQNALEQIKIKNYKQQLVHKGITNILEMGIAFEGKEISIGTN